MAFSDALDREAAWLNTTTDTGSAWANGVPILPSSAGGPFQVIQARWPRVPSTNKTSIYVLRATSRSFHVARYASQRSLLTTMFRLRVRWPVAASTAAGTGAAEASSLQFEQAIDTLLARIEGPVGDKTHGFAFLSVAETQNVGITVDVDDPEQTLAGGFFAATVTYSADDPELTN